MCRCILRTFSCVLLLSLCPFPGNISAVADLCPSCKQSYPDFTRLAVHCAFEHGFWLCQKCPKYLCWNKEDYKLHHTKEHGEIVCFACNLRIFPNKTQLDKTKWERHLKKHKEKCIRPVPPNSSLCCLRVSLSKESTVWSQQLHRAHIHGSWLEFLVATRPLFDCCKPFPEAILVNYSDYLKSNWSDDMREKFLKGINNFSNHVYEKHGLCFLCERELTHGSDQDMFGRQPIGADVFLRKGGHVLTLPKDLNFTCFCGKRAQRNAESRLFALKIDRLPFGTGLDTVTHPFYWVTNKRKSAKKAPSKGLKMGNAVPSKFGEKRNGHPNKPIKSGSETPQLPSFSVRSGDAPFTGTNEKKHKDSTVSKGHLIPLTDNGANGKSFKNL